MIIKIDTYLFSYLLSFCDIESILQLYSVNKKIYNIIYDYSSINKLCCSICNIICNINLHINNVSGDYIICCNKCYYLLKLNNYLTICDICNRYTTDFISQESLIIENICANCCDINFIYRSWRKKTPLYNSQIINYYDDEYYIIAEKFLKKNFSVLSIDIIKCIYLAFKFGYLDENYFSIFFNIDT